METRDIISNVGRTQVNVLIGNQITDWVMVEEKGNETHDIIVLRRNKYFSNSKSLPTYLGSLCKERIISTKDAALYLGISTKTLYKWGRERKIPYIRVGKLWKFDLDLLEVFVESRKG